VVDFTSLRGSGPPGSAAGAGPPRRPPAPPEFWEDPEDYESESVEEFLFKHKFLARLAMRAADRAYRLLAKKRADEVSRSVGPNSGKRSV
jgi:hypothetical protein